MKVDLYATHKADYIAPKSPKLVKIEKAQYLAIQGRGKPGGEEYQACIGAMYAVAYTLKFTSKFAGQDYSVGKLETIYWLDDEKQCWADEPMENWNWKVLIRTPDFIGKEELKAAQAKLKEKGNPFVNKVKLEKLTEGNSVQMLHTGPYDQVARTIESMRAFAEADGMEFHKHHHEIYLSDPRRVAPEKLKTILRIPVHKA